MQRSLVLCASAVAASETVNTTVMTSCSVCADQLSRSALTERLCSAEFGERYTLNLHPSIRNSYVLWLLPKLFCVYDADCVVCDMQLIRHPLQPKASVTCCCLYGLLALVCCCFGCVLPSRHVCIWTSTHVTDAFGCNGCRINCISRHRCVLSVAKVQPSRYIRAGDSLKLLASKSTKFYKIPKSAASSRRRAVFFLHGTSAAHCSCLQAAGVVDGQPPGRGARDEGSLLVAGRLEEVGGRRRRTRLVVTAAVKLSSRALVRRAVRLTRNADICQRRTARTERRSSSRPGRRRRRRPDRMTSHEQREEKVVTNGEKSDGRKRPRLQQRVVDGARPSRKRKLQRNRRGRQQQHRRRRRRQHN